MTYYSADPVRFGGVSMVTATPGANDPEVGVLVREGDEEYVFVYNAGNSQINPGQLAVVSAVTGYSVTVSSVTNLDIAVGVCKHATITTATYGFLLRYGFGSAKAPAGSSIAAGDLLCAGGDGVWSTKSISTGIPNPAQAKAMTATASAGLADAWFTIF